MPQGRPATDGHGGAVGHLELWQGGSYLPIMAIRAPAADPDGHEIPQRLCQ